MRVLLVANGVLLAIFAGLYVVFGARPSGYVAGGILAAAALALWALVPLTDPYRSERAGRW